MIPKYRAWHKTWEEMGKVKRIRFDDDGNANNVLFKGKEFGVNAKINELELMQPTGIFDKNGKDIFEGDILEIQGIKLIVKFGSYKYIIETLIKGVLLSGALQDGVGSHVEAINVKTLNKTSPFKEEILKNSQIIGNVYENPELLEGTE